MPMRLDRAHRFDDVVQFARALQRVEIELGYAETPIEAPGLTVPRTQNAPATEDDDRTRARGITSIAAQQPVAPPAANPGEDATRARQVPVVAQPPAAVVPPAAWAPRVEESTVRRSPAAAPAPAAAAPPVAPVATAAEPVAEPDAARPGRGRLVGILVALLAVVATVVVVVLVVISQPDLEREPEQALVGDAGDPLLGDIVPSPELVSATRGADGTTATFEWSNPDPRDGDSYVWMRTDPTAPEAPAQKTTTPALTLDGLTPGVPVCVSIEIVRSGQGSAAPLEECVP
jgi:eukaryotic-like serine/threonine-protein kinase